MRQVKPKNSTLKTLTIAEVEKLAKEEHRSFSTMLDILVNEAIASRKARTKKLK